VTKCPILGDLCVCVSGTWCSHSSQIRDAGTPSLCCQRLEPVGGPQHQLLEQLGVYNLQPQGGNSVCSQNQLLGDTGMSEASQGLGAGGWKRDARLYPPQTQCAWAVHVCNHQQTSGWTRWQVGDRGSGQQCQAGRGAVPVLGIREHACACEPGECPVHATLVTFSLGQPRRRRGLGCLPSCL